ncbi:zonular occludens toxin domain-containing protein [Stenotrophomonas terrae]|uniref:zonular occludens toxin domain-containing protein n=1 Tax=Stenotrophomonas terrae TaxID=405446 RepID=UPI0032089037
MYYQFTGQPGHGKTVLAIERALEMKAKADKLHAEDPSKHPVRELYVCNVRDFNHGAAHALPLSPEELKGWADHPDYLRRIAEFKDSQQYLSAGGAKEREEAFQLFLESAEMQRLANECINPPFENAIILVDEAYESGMFPRRPAGRFLPRHVERVAKHRHFGIDFIMICQSPKKQMDDFLHDLIEEHYHVRRRFGLPFVHMKRWDRFESNPDKATPLTNTRRKYPTKVFKLYTSTKYDTSEKRVPWYYWAAGLLVVWTLGSAYFAKERIDERMAGTQSSKAAAKDIGADGAAAKGATTGRSEGRRDRGTPQQYVESFSPRVPAQPWSAPAYDGLAVPGESPRLFCMVAGPGIDAQGNSRELSCGCKTEQGTRYEIDFDTCATIARHGQYEPFLARSKGEGAQQRETAPTGHPQRSSSSGTGGSVVSFKPGARADVFPMNPAQTIGGYTPPTSTL